MESSAKRRVRRRGRAASGPQGAAPEQSPSPVPVPGAAAAQPRSSPSPATRGAAADAQARRGARRSYGADGGLRDIVGAGPSQLGVSKALRGRDVNRPSDADIAEAERDTVLVRRNWRPDPS